MLETEWKWPGMAIQGAVLGAIIYYTSNNPAKFNHFFLLSLIIIGGLFILQTMNSRFLWLYPVNQLMHEPVLSIDTWILRTLIPLSIFTLILGFIYNHLDYWGILDYLNSIFKTINYWLLIFLFIFFPILWVLYLGKLNQNIVVNKLRKEKKVQIIKGECPKCNGNLFKREIKVIDKNIGEEKYYCLSPGCDFKSKPAKIKMDIAPRYEVPQWLLNTLEKRRINKMEYERGKVKLNYQKTMREILSYQFHTDMVLQRYRAFLLAIEGALFALYGFIKGDANPRSRILVISFIGIFFAIVWIILCVRRGEKLDRLLEFTVQYFRDVEDEAQISGNNVPKLPSILTRFKGNKDMLARFTFNWIFPLAAMIIWGSIIIF